MSYQLPRTDSSFRMTVAAVAYCGAVAAYITLAAGHPATSEVVPLVTAAVVGLNICLTMVIGAAVRLVESSD